MIPNQLMDITNRWSKGKVHRLARIINICELTWSRFETFGKNGSSCGSYDTAVARFAAVKCFA
jgi:hypothetical protein